MVTNNNNEEDGGTIATAQPAYGGGKMSRQVQVSE